MASPYVTGPVDAWANIGGTPRFIGHCERSPSVQLRPYYDPVFNDLAGQRVPLDVVYQSCDAMISLDLTRYNESTYLLLASRPGNVIRGTNIPGDIGTLMLGEGKAFTLWLRFPYAAKPPMQQAVSNVSGGPMPAGYRFAAAYLEGPDDLGPLGTTARRLRLNFHALPLLIAGGNSPLGAATFFLYDHDVSALPANAA